MSLPKKRRDVTVPNHRKGKGKAFAWIAAHVTYAGDDCLKWPFSGFQGMGFLGHMGKRWRAPRLMCTLAHGEPPTPEHEAAHECGNGHLGCMNPRHLKWKTRSENRQDCKRHGTDARCKRRMSPAQVYEIRALQGCETGTSVADRYGISDDAVYSIWKRRTWPKLPEQNTLTLMGRNGA